MIETRTPQSQPQETSPDLSLAQTTIDTRLTRRDLLIMAGVSVAATATSAHLYSSHIQPHILETQELHKTHFSKALELTTTYNKNFSGLGEKLNFEFKAPGTYEIEIQTSDGYSRSRTATFSITANEHGPGTVQRRIGNGTLVDSTPEEFAAHLESLNGLSHASTQMKLTYTSPAGKVQEATDFY